MKILLTGGGTGGHVYPIMAVADALRELASEKKLLDVKLYYMADQPYNERMLYDRDITFLPISTGKMRRYFSLMNAVDMVRTFFSAIKTVFTVYNIYPDVVFGKGGYISFPALFAARILRIPVIIHESDSVPGAVNRWAGKFAKKVAVSYADAAQYFAKEKVAQTGNPIRRDLMLPLLTGADEHFGLEPGIPTILFMGGSQGSRLINETLMDALPELIKKYQILHQTGKRNYDDVVKTRDVVLLDNPHKKHYKPLDYMNEYSIRLAAGRASLVVTRAGSTLYEIAYWGLPSIVIPITDSGGDHQRRNAFNYARTGAALVIEERNLSPHVLISEIEKLMDHPEIRERMSRAAKGFAGGNAARTIAEEILKIALRHEQ